MQTLERIVYILIAIIVFGMILFYSVRVDYRSTLIDLEHDEKTELTFNEHDYVWKIADHWEECAFGELEVSRTYIADFTSDWPGGAITYEMFMKRVKALYLCEQIWDEAQDCGDRNPPVVGASNFDTIENHHAYLVSCRPGVLEIKSLS